MKIVCAEVDKGQVLWNIHNNKTSGYKYFPLLHTNGCVRVSAARAGMYFFISLSDTSHLSIKINFRKKKFFTL